MKCGSVVALGIANRAPANHGSSRRAIDSRDSRSSDKSPNEQLFSFKRFLMRRGLGFARSRWFRLLRRRTRYRRRLDGERI